MTIVQHINTSLLIGEVIQVWSYDDNVICRLQTNTDDGNFLVNVILPRGVKMGVKIEVGTVLQVIGVIRNDEVEKSLSRLVKGSLPEELKERKVMQIYTQVYASSWQVIL